MSILMRSSNPSASSLHVHLRIGMMSYLGMMKPGHAELYALSLSLTSGLKDYTVLTLHMMIFAVI